MSRKRNLPAGITVLSIRLSSDLHERIKRIAEEEHRTVSQEVRHALEAHVEQATKEAA